MEQKSRRGPVARDIAKGNKKNSVEKTFYEGASRRVFNNRDTWEGTSPHLSDIAGRGEGG